jgi:type IV secretion system protein VirB2
MMARASKHWAWFVALALLEAVLTDPAYAGLPNLTTAATNFQNILTGVSATVATIAVLIIGYKMLYEHVPYSEIGRAAIACVILGGAGTIVGLLI